MDKVMDKFALSYDVSPTFDGNNKRFGSGRAIKTTL